MKICYHIPLSPYLQRITKKEGHSKIALFFFVVVSVAMSDECVIRSPWAKYEAWHGSGDLRQW